MTVPAESEGPSLPRNPLPPCPETPNCQRLSRKYDVSPDALYTAAQEALEALGPVSLHLRPDMRRAEAVYRVALVLKDDVDVVVQLHDDRSVLHLRSASRSGYSDLGVNRRRIHRFFDALQGALDAE